MAPIYVQEALYDRGAHVGDEAARSCSSRTPSRTPGFPDEPLGSSTRQPGVVRAGRPAEPLGSSDEPLGASLGSLRLPLSLAGVLRRLTAGAACDYCASVAERRTTPVLPMCITRRGVLS